MYLYENDNKSTIRKLIIKINMGYKKTANLSIIKGVPRILCCKIDTNTIKKRFNPKKRRIFCVRLIGFFPKINITHLIKKRKENTPTTILLTIIIMSLYEEK